MTRAQLVAATKKLCDQVAPPFGEDAATRRLHEWLKELGLTFRTDAHGNTVARIRHGMPKRAVAFVAHLDRPAFRVDAVNGIKATCRADGLFLARGLKGYRVSFPRAAGSKAAGGVIERVVTRTSAAKGDDTVASVVVALDSEDVVVGENDFCMLDTPEPPAHVSRLTLPRGCNLAACAGIVGGLAHAQQGRSEVDAWGLFTRAGAVGFQGAVGAALDGTLPREMLTIAVECVEEAAGFEAGKGPVVVLADANGPLDPRGYAALMGTALDAERKAGPVQSAVLPAHASQAAALAAFGYATAALCLPLAAGSGRPTKAKAPQMLLQLDVADLAATVRMIGETALRVGAGIDDSDARRNDLVRASQEGRELLRLPLDTKTGYPTRRMFS